MGFLGEKQMRKKNIIKNHAQMLTIMGIILAISIFVISSLAAEIANIDFVVSTGESISLSTEFKNIKDTYAVALNYNLIRILIDGNESRLNGDIDYIIDAFNQTRDEYFILYFQHGILFDAYFNDYWYSHEVELHGKNTVFYWVEITLSIDDGDSYIAETIEHLIACTPEIS